VAALRAVAQKLGAIDAEAEIAGIFRAEIVMHREIDTVLPDIEGVLQTAIHRRPYLGRQRDGDGTARDEVLDRSALRRPAAGRREEGQLRDIVLGLLVGDQAAIIDLPIGGADDQAIKHAQSARKIEIETAAPTAAGGRVQTAIGARDRQRRAAGGAIGGGKRDLAAEGAAIGAADWRD